VALTIQGRPGSAGTFTGVARVVFTPEDYPKLRRGEVVVSPTATPELANVLDRVGAVVTDVGGALSHVVVVSLQLGIPAVVSATGASRRIHNGTVVTVDGTNGSVVVASGRAKRGERRQS
jgi:pyruvate,water dikinase